MKRATPITISGQIFHLDDEGYELLRDYLDSLRAHFGGSPGAEEIMADIEARVAERLAEILATDRANSIPLWRLAELADGIGHPKDFEEFGRESEASGSRIQDRRLFRDLEGGLLAGVASGLGAYLGLDASLIRAAFVLSGLLGGAGAILYLVLWLVLPPARSSSDRLRMEGRPVTAPAIARLFPGAETVAAESGAVRRALGVPLTLSRRVVYAMADMMRTLANRFVPILRTGTGAALVASATILIFLVCLFTTLFLLRLPASYLDPDIFTFLDRVPYRLLVSFGAVSLLVPGALVLVAGISLLRARNLMQPAVGFGLVGIWFVALLVTGVLGTRSVMEWQSYTRTDPLFERISLTLDPEELHSVHLSGGLGLGRVQEGAASQVTVSGRRKEMDRFEYSIEEGVLRMNLNRPVASCVLCDQQPVRVTVTAPVPDSVRVVRGVISLR